MIYLIDASVYVFRAHHRALDPDLPERIDLDGNPVQAVWGFARLLADLLERVRPRFIAVAFDHRRSGSFRNRIYAPYKANREAPPPGIALQFERCFELCGLMGVAAIASEEYEADDLIGSAAWQMRERGVRATLVTRDKDLAQLLRDGDALWDCVSGAPLGYHDVARRFGVLPERFADYLALTGDAVDNIPGVPGIGPKTAATLMREFDSLESLYEGLERVPLLSLRGAASLPTRLRMHRETAYLARRLTRIACDAPLACGPQQWQWGRPDLAGLTRFFDHHGFGVLLRQQAQRLARVAA